MCNRQDAISLCFFHALVLSALDFLVRITPGKHPWMTQETQSGPHLMASLCTGAAWAAPDASTVSQGAHSSALPAGQVAQGGAGEEAAAISPGPAAAADAPGEVGPVCARAALAEQPGPGARCSLGLPVQHH